MDIAALVIGADLIEKTITEDRMTRSVEHIMSLEQPHVAAFVSVMRDVEVALGVSRRVLHPFERDRRLAVRRSLFLGEDVKAGTSLCAVKIEFRRPGHGIAPDRYEELANANFGKDLPAGHMIQMSDLKFG